MPEAESKVIAAFGDLELTITGAGEEEIFAVYKNGEMRLESKNFYIAAWNFVGGIEHMLFKYGRNLYRQRGKNEFTGGKS